jgi:DNA invertase Pin-like site-specific DNA recombinase
MSAVTNRAKMERRLPKRVAGYLRGSSISCSEQPDDIESQRSRIQTAVRDLQHDGAWESVELAFYGDPDLSASAAERAGLEHLKQKIAKRQINAVVITSLDRLARNMSEIAAFWQFLDANGVELVSLQERLDTSSLIGRVMTRLLSLYAELAREVTA